MVRVEVSLVHGGDQSWTEGDSLVREMEELKRSGLKGKALIHALIADDWGPPPIGVRIRGTLEDGSTVNEWIPYT